MSIRNIQVTALPYPVHTLQIGSIRLDLSDDHDSVQLRSWVPRFTKVAQVVEVYGRGSADYESHNEIVDDMLGNYLIIENARPELFVRRDFIKDFVKKGHVHVLTDDEIEAPYELLIDDRTMSILLTDRQYRRFGLTTGKPITHNDSRAQTFKVDIDLSDDRILKSNKFQDKLVEKLRRLEPIKRVYFRFDPRSEDSKRIESGVDNSCVNCMDFFRYVLDEYAADGMKPVPLTGCSEASQKLSRKWTNYSQPKPSSVDLSRKSIYSDDREALDKFTGLLDWLGFQVLSLDINRDGSTDVRTSANDARVQGIEPKEMVDVLCAEICSGVMDSSRIEQYLKRVFGRREEAKGDNTSGLLFRALVLYGEDKFPGSVKTAGSNSLFWSDWFDDDVPAEYRKKRLGWMNWSS